MNWSFSTSAPKSDWFGTVPPPLIQGPVDPAIEALHMPNGWVAKLPL